MRTVAHETTHNAQMHGDSAAPVPLPIVEFMGVRFTNIDFKQLSDVIESHVTRRVPMFIVTPNVDHVIRLDRDPALREAYQAATAVLADGVPILWASRLLGKPIVAKLSGSDLVPALSELAAQKGYRVFLFGAAPGIADEAAVNLERTYPGLQIAGTYCPPIGFELDAAENAKAVAAVHDSKADILFCALGCPKQELWLHRHASDLDVPVSLGIGASLDFAAGRIRRAPRWIQRCGAEWLWRLAQEPRRLWRRYLVDDMRFVPMFWQEFRTTRFGGRGK